VNVGNTVAAMLCMHAYPEFRQVLAVSDNLQHLCYLRACWHWIRLLLASARSFAVMCAVTVMCAVASLTGSWGCEPAATCTFPAVSDCAAGMLLLVAV
jgi:hypothetical protein